MPDDALLPMYRVLTIMVNKNDTSDVQSDLSEFATWEVPALFKHILQEMEMDEALSFTAEEDEEDE